MAENVFISLTCEGGVATILYVSPKSWKYFKKAHPEYTDNDFDECLRKDLVTGQNQLTGGAYEITFSKAKV